MRHFPTPLLLSALPGAAAVLLAIGAVTPAEAGIPGNWLQLTVTEGDSRSSDTRGTLLLCDPPQGHARAAEACDQLTAANGDVGAVPPKADTVCSLVHAPLTARAHGQWNGRPVTYAKTFPNACVMGAETGAIFSLDDEQLPDLVVPGLPL
ncbi:SSI family serine proteinase inhibitor [Streptomyces sp. NPDC002328]|uniref:SSI family serine proteinase inhibitor n=1 Tax=Streptomyces sp. NPDC002328 TaxID=3364642 RepID=UPI0036C7DEA6